MKIPKRHREKPTEEHRKHFGSGGFAGEKDIGTEVDLRKRMRSVKQSADSKTIGKHELAELSKMKVKLGIQV